MAGSFHGYRAYSMDETLDPVGEGHGGVPGGVSQTWCQEEDQSSGIGSDVDDGPQFPYVWSKGDKCEAEYSGDGCYYKSKIRHIYKNEHGCMMALVSFAGFNSDCDEEKEVTSLRKPKEQRRKQPSKERCAQRKTQAAAMFSPLCGNEEKHRLEEKFRMMEKEEEEERQNAKPSYRTTTKRLLDPVQPSLKSRRKGVGREKTSVATGGEDRQPRRQTENSTSTHGSSRSPVSRAKSSKSSSQQSTPRHVVTSTGLSSDSEEEAQAMRDGHAVSGFDEEDMEKPNFKHAAPCPKVPFILSDPEEDSVVQVPATINQYLREYQREGIEFLYKNFRKGCGGILGDDMGLGKTVQVIGFMSAVLKKTGTKQDVIQLRPRFIRKMSEDQAALDEEYQGPNKTFLIIGPASILYNWVDELETWGHFVVGKYHMSHKQETLANLRKEKLDVVVTTYETCRDDIDELNRFEWCAVIADEVHKVKGERAKVTKALKAIKCRKRYGLTGTALQNNVEELWCILDWANPGCLGDQQQFRAKFSKKIEQGQRRDATKRELAEARKAKEGFAELRQKWMIRRTKALIAHQLPKKEEQVVYCRPTALQVSVYKAVLGHPDMQLILAQKLPCDCGSGRTKGRCCYKETSDGRKIEALTMTYLQLLLKTSNHVALLMPDKTQSNHQKRHAMDICKVAFADHPHFLAQTQEASFRTLSDPKYCGKMKVLQGLLAVFRKKKDKVLLFSYSTQLLDIIEQYTIGMGYEYRRLDGKTPTIQRVQIVREFNKDPNLFLFLASTKAGGVGLNLTGANRVVIFDPNWNPTHDLQAQDRAYRIGQGRDVSVYRLICVGTIEENMYLRQIYKQQLDNVAVTSGNARRYFHGVPGDRHNKGELYGLENMFTLRTGDSCLTLDILKRNNKLEAGLTGFSISQYIPPSVEKKTDSDPEDQIHDNEGTSEENEESVPSGGEDENETDDQHGLGFIVGQLTQDKSSKGKSERKHAGPATCAKSDLDNKSSDCDSDADSFLDDRRHDALQTTTATGRHGSAWRNKRQNRINSDSSDEGETCQRSGGSHPCRCEQCQNPQPSTSRGFGRNKSASSEKRRTSSDKYENNSRSPSQTSKRLKTTPALMLTEDPNKKCTLLKGRTLKRTTVSPGLDIEQYSTDESPVKYTGKKKGKSKRAKVSFEKMEAHESPSLEQTLATSFDSIGDVFKTCKVVHTHQNKSIIGASKAEDLMSRRAIEDVYELHQYSQQPAACCQPDSQSSEESDDLGEANRQQTQQQKGKPAETIEQSEWKPANPKVKLSQSLCRAVVIGTNKVLIGQTPRGIRKKQFRQMVVAMGVESTEELARKVLFSTKEEKMDMLKTFYTSQDATLAAAFSEPDPEEMQQTGTVKRRGGKNKGRKTRPKVKWSNKASSRQKHGCKYESDSEELTDTKVTSRSKVNTKRQQGNKSVSCMRKAKKERNKDGKRVSTQMTSSVEGDANGNTTVGYLLEEPQKGNHFRGQAKVTSDDRELMLKEGIVQPDNVNAADSPHTPRQHGHGKQDETTFDFLDNFFFDDVVKKKQTPKRKAACRQRAAPVVDTRQTDEKGRGDLLDFLDATPTRSTTVPKRGWVKDDPETCHGQSSFDIFAMDMDLKATDSPKRKGAGRGTKQEKVNISDEEDWYGDRDKWQKNPKKKSPLVNILDQSTLESVDLMINEDNEAYQKLFKS